MTDSTPSVEFLHQPHSRTDVATGYIEMLQRLDMPHNRCTSSVIATKLCVRLKTLDIKEGHSHVQTRVKSDKNKVHNPGYVPFRTRVDSCNWTADHLGCLANPCSGPVN